MLSALLNSSRPIIMGIVNITPDSFSDGGKYFSPDAAISHATSLIDEGADILDIGGESTRPGAASVNLADELQRVMPVIEALRRSHPTMPLSIDTQKPEVMRAAIEAGVAMVNDVNALRTANAIEICAASTVYICLMHMQKSPQVMQDAPQYSDVMVEVIDFLQSRASACVAAGIDARRIVIDPGIGFGKSLAHNIALLRGIPQLSATGYPTLIGVSRKSIFNTLLNRDVNDRLVPSVVTALYAAKAGAKILRVHDVRETCDALKLVHALSS